MTIKKYLNQFHWYSETNDELYNRIPTPIERGDYPSSYQTAFGMNTPVSFLRIEEKVMPPDNFLKFEKLILSNGFEVLERGISSFKYIHYDKKIVLSGDVIENDDDEDEYEYDEDAPAITSGENQIFISILPTKENREFIEPLMKGIAKCLIDVSKDENRFYLIAQNQQGLYSQKTRCHALPIKDDRYDLFYGRKFPYDKMKKFIDEKTENLLLLHGDPGSGKSNLLKNLIKNSKRKVIYIPPGMVGVISSPQFVSFILKNAGSILLIEDAEEILSVDRNSGTNNLLQICDGFLKDSLDLKVIATFNIEIGRIDPALLRKGRLYYEHHFGQLTEDECKDLAAYLKINRPIDGPMTLAEFFNIEENSSENSFEPRRMGFL